MAKGRHISFIKGSLLICSNKMKRAKMATAAITKQQNSRAYSILFSGGRFFRPDFAQCRPELRKGIR